MIGERLVALLRPQINFLGSSRLAAVLLPVVVALLAVYLFIPQHAPGQAELVDRWVDQKGLVGKLFDALWLTDIRHSWLFYAAYSLLFVNLLLCMIRRFSKAVQLCRFPDEPPQVPSLGYEREVEATGLGAESLASLLQKKGYRTLVERDSVYALRGRFSVVGHWLFHVSFLVLMVGVGLAIAGPGPFRGTVGIGEGELFDLQSAPFLASNQPLSPELPDLRFQVRKINYFAQGTDLRRFEATLISPGGERATMGVNRPYRRAPYQVMVHGFGFMPGWVIANERGRMLSGAWVKLVPFPLEAEDSFSLGRDGDMVHVRFYPDYEVVGDEERSRSYQARNPRLRARIELQGEAIFEGLLEPGEKVPIGEGKQFFFHPEIRMYTMLDVIQEKGYVLAFACMGGAILGLLIRYARIRKEIRLQLSDGSLRIAGRSEMFQGLFAEELETLVREIATASLEPEDQKGAAWTR
jgi:hypothetical protein